MINSVVFDVGNVLLRFCPEQWLAGRYSPDIAPALMKTVFHSGEWLELDRGTLSPQEATARFQSRRPELAAQIGEVMEQWLEMMTPVPGSLELLEALEGRGLGLYYLSNMGEQAAGSIRREYDFWRHFGGGIFSCEIHRLKPETEIYLDLFRRYRLEPGACVFQDDSKANIRTAQGLGMEGIVFPRRRTPKTSCGSGLPCRCEGRGDLWAFMGLRSIGCHRVPGI